MSEQLYDPCELPAHNYSPSQLEDLNIQLSFILSLVLIYVRSGKQRRKNDNKNKKH